MKKIAFVLYTVACLALGGLVWQGVTQAAGYLSGQYYQAYPLSAPPGYREVFGVSLENGAKRGDVFVDWKSSENFVVFIK